MVSWESKFASEPNKRLLVVNLEVVSTTVGL